jgi:5-formyltetrahydrofolate cyclo-ligase
MRRVIAGLTGDQRAQADTAISANLASLATLRSANTIMVYLPLDDEIDLRLLMDGWIREGRTVCVPLVNWDQKRMQPGMLSSLSESTLTAGPHGIREPRDPHPLPASMIEVVIVPGLAFDATGARLGRGGGFYDRFLDTVTTAVTLGVALQEQILHTVPCEKHDRHMAAVITPQGVLTGPP